MTRKLELASGFTTWCGQLLLGYLDEEMDADYFNVTPENVGQYLDIGVDNVADQVGEASELLFVRPMLELLIACNREDIKAFGLGVDDVADLTFPGAVICGMPDEDWKLVFEYARHKLFGLPPMTDAEKQAVKQEVTIIDESLDDFRARMRAEGRLPAPQP
jgi:hypothetical protein